MISKFLHNRNINIIAFIFLLISLERLYMDIDSVFAFNKNAGLIKGLNFNVFYITLYTSHDKILIKNTPMQIVLAALCINMIEFIIYWIYNIYKKRKGKK